MGLAIDKEVFGPRDYELFEARLDSCLDVLGKLLDRPGFGEGAHSLGAELELALIGDDASPLPVNLEVIGETLDPRMTVELDRFNLECNLRYSPLTGRPFSALTREIDEALVEIRRAAGRHGGRPVAIGILPTTMEEDLQSGAMTDTVRFRVLSAALQRLRREPFELQIDGDEPLAISCDDVTFEGAATSMQVHLRVTPRDFAAVFNATQLATGPALAIAGNSPTFLGHRLWEETRVALFKQAVDLRSESAKRRGQPARVSFGNGWVREGALELFAEAVANHGVLIPILGPEDPAESLRERKVPLLDEIRLHQGTVWSWNRPVYDSADGGHLRIELRALPAGPSTPDMVANCAFLVGLSLGLAGEMDGIRAELPFAAAHDNFYRAAQFGLDAELSWPTPGGGETRKVRAAQLARELVPVARDGLLGAGVEADEIDPLLGIIEERCARGVTGSTWQRDALRSLEANANRKEALGLLVEHYHSRSLTGRPVHEWEPV